MELKLCYFIFICASITNNHLYGYDTRYAKTRDSYACMVEGFTRYLQAINIVTVTK